MKNKNKRPNPARRIIGDILIVLFGLILIDTVVIMLRKINMVVLKDTYQNVFIREVIFLVILILFALDIRFGIFTKIRNKAAKVIGWILRIAVIIVSAVIIILCGRVAAGSLINTAAPANYTIVLGLALENGKPVQDLYYRVETAKKYYDENPETVLVLTGGNADEFGKTEADVMKEILLEYGVPEDAMYLEDQAKTTIENFQNTLAMTEPGEPIVLISSNYHMDRAVLTAKDAGFTTVLRLPAPSEILAYGSNMMWEVIMDLDRYSRQLK